MIERERWNRVPKMYTETERAHLATKNRSQPLLEFISAVKNRSSWAVLYERAPTKEYSNPLIGETDALPPGARHAILWSLQPATQQLEDYIEELMYSLSDMQQEIIIKLREALQKDITYPTARHTGFGLTWSNFKSLAEKVNDGEVFNVDLLSIIERLSKDISCFQENAHRSLSESGFGMYKEKKNRPPDFMVFTREGHAPLIITESRQDMNSAVGHEDTFKLFEQCQHALENNAKQSVFRQIMGQLNGGKRSTIFISSCIKMNGEIYYELRWLKNAHLIHTFDYSYEFVPQIFTLYLCFSLAKPTFDDVTIKHLAFRHTVSRGESIDSENSENSDAEDEGDQECDRVSDTVGHDSFSVGSQLGFFTVAKRLNKTFVYLEYNSECFAGKICKLKNGAPWELQFIKSMPLKTILQPYSWCILDSEHYMMVYKKVPTTPIQSYFTGILREIFLTFEYLHERGIVHANVKFNNAFVWQDTFFLTDFDKAGQLADVQDREFVGTTGHVAPELFAGKPYSFAAEMYSIGVMLIEMFHRVPLAGVFEKYANNFDWYKRNHLDIQQSLLQIFNCFWGWNNAVLDYKIPMPMLEAFKRLIHALLSVDPKDRPTAQQVLYSDEYKDLWIREKSCHETILSSRPNSTWRFENVDLPNKIDEEKNHDDHR